MKFIVKVAFVE